MGLTKVPSVLTLKSAVSKTTTYTSTVYDDAILGSTSGGAWTLTVHTAVGNSGQRLVLVKTDTSSNLWTVTGSAGQLGGKTSIVLSGQYDLVEFVSDGTIWQPMSFDTMLRTVSAYISGNGVSSPTVTDEFGAWVASTARSNFGIYSATIRTGIFSAAPDVQFTAYSNLDNDRYSVGVWSASAVTSTSIPFSVNWTDDVGGTTDARNERADSSNVWITARGPR